MFHLSLFLFIFRWNMSQTCSWQVWWDSLIQNKTSRLIIICQTTQKLHLTTYKWSVHLRPLHSPHQWPDEGVSINNASDLSIIERYCKITLGKVLLPPPDSSTYQSQWPKKQEEEFATRFSKVCKVSGIKSLKYIQTFWDTYRVIYEQSCTLCFVFWLLFSVCQTLLNR